MFSITQGKITAALLAIMGLLASRSTADATVLRGSTPANNQRQQLALECPEVDSNAFDACPEESSPIRCSHRADEDGPFQSCVYKNPCVAKRAGFKTKKWVCVSVAATPAAGNDSRDDEDEDEDKLSTLGDEEESIVQDGTTEDSSTSSQEEEESSTSSPPPPQPAPPSGAKSSFGTARDKNKHKTTSSVIVGVVSLVSVAMVALFFVGKIVVRARNLKRQGEQSNDTTNASEQPSDASSTAKPAAEGGIDDDDDATQVTSTSSAPSIA